MEHKIAVAPMVDITNRFFRYFMRLFTAKATLYTEMIVDQALLHNPALAVFDPAEHPVVAQLGGCSPTFLTQAAQAVASLGYDEINLNCGCPSSKIQSGRFGACLMLNPEEVNFLCRSLREAVTVPVTVKCRLGVDDHDSYEHFANFVGQVKASGIESVIVHARKALLSGLTPAQNRSVPPLKYDWVYRIKQEHPDLEVWLNGGVNSHEEVSEHLQRGVDGIMIGRQAYNNPWMFSTVDSRYYATPDPGLSRLEILEDYGEFCDRIQTEERTFNHCYMAKPLTNLFHGEKFNRQYRAELDRVAKQQTSWEFKPVVDTLVRVMEDLNPDSLRARPSDCN